MSEVQQDLGSIGVKLNNSSWAGKLVKDSYLAIKQGKYTWLLVSFEIVYYITLVTFAFLLLAFFYYYHKAGCFMIYRRNVLWNFLVYSHCMATRHFQGLDLSRLIMADIHFMQHSSTRKYYSELNNSTFNFYL